MIGHIARRIGTAIILAVLVTFITFLLLSTSFENVTRKILGSGANEQTVAAMMQRQGFDRPVLVQYFDWLTSALSGDFGRSIFTSLEVVPVVLQRFGVTLSLIIPGLIICALISVLLGIWAGVVEPCPLPRRHPCRTTDRPRVDASWSSCENPRAAGPGRAA